MTLLEEGDAERAILEFRNVLKLNGRHREARTEYAALQRRRGNVGSAIGQYLRLVEQYPDDLDGRISLSELSIQTSNWEDAETHIAAAFEIGPENPVVQALKTAVDYRKAVVAQDGDQITDVMVQVRKLRQQIPDYRILRQISINELIRNSEMTRAITEIDKAIADQPDDLGLYQLRLTVLGQLGDTGAIEDQLISMVEKFPGEPIIRNTLVRWFVSRGNIDSAEAFLRNSIDPASDDDTNTLTLVRFLAEMRGQDAAIGELDELIAAGNSSPVLRALRAGMVFDTVDREQGIADMRAVLAESEPSEDQRNIKIGLAKMLISTGNSVGARALVEEVLAQDSSNVEALKQKANWLIDDDEVGEAIVALRTALDHAPKDADILSLMARAYERDGNQELVGEMLSLAVDTSNNAPVESIRYATYLAKLEKHITAEEILIAALRIAPQNVAILSSLGKLYVEMKDWSRAEQVAATLGKIDNDTAQTAKNSITATLLQAQEKTGEVVVYLENLVARGEGGLSAHLGIIRSHLAAGDPDVAGTYIKSLLAEDPDNPDIRFIGAAVDAALGDVARAEKIYRELLAEDGNRPQVWVALFRIISSQNRPDEAEAVVKQALQAAPEDETILWLYASFLERQDDIKGAIEIYEAMYAKNSSNLIVANNLASLLTFVSEDPDAIERAYTIARRLRSVESAPFQDTFGWIALLRGEIEVAIQSLEPAAAALVNDPTVQYHLARAYLAADRNADALAQFIKVLDLTGAGDTRNFIEESRGEIVRLQTAQDSKANE